MMKKFFTLAIIYLLPFCLLIYLLAQIFFPQKPNAYTKITLGQPISILVAGDSIGAGSGASKPEYNFANRLKATLQEKYSVSSSIVNTSMSGNTTYASLIRVFKLKGYNFDLVILCSGQNDNASNLGKYYEALIRNIKIKYPNAEIISVLQSSQKTYTDKIKTIQTIAQYYNIPTADTIAPFTNGENGSYTSLTVDGIHPTNRGYAIYAKVLEDLINKNVHCKQKSKTKQLPPPLFPDSLYHVCFQELSTNILTRTNNIFTGKINLPKSSLIGMEVYFISGTNYYEVLINEKSIVKKQFYWKYSDKHFITDIVQTSITGPSTITINFGSSKQANSFKGFFVTYPKQND